MTMKKFFIGTALIATLALSSTSCGGGDRAEVNNDTVITRELTDSMSRTLGAFMGVNLQDEVRYSDQLTDYIEGYQLIAGNKYSNEKLRGIRAGLFAAEQFANMEMQGVPVNRDLFMQEFRNYLQKMDLDPAEYNQLYNEFQTIMRQIDNILMAREQMRMGVEVPQIEIEEEIADSLTNAGVETEVVETAVAASDATGETVVDEITEPTI